jgi:hypothetical protein
MHQIWHRLKSHVVPAKRGEITVMDFDAAG